MLDICDIHCHILPEVDDGADSMKSALGLLKKEYDDGVRTIILTPHYRRRMFETPMKKIYNQYELLCKEAAKEVPDIRLELGCEYHVNMDMSEVLTARERPTMAGSRYVLSEFSEKDPEAYLKERCYHLIVCGYIPILAHIERCEALRKNLNLIDDLIEMGCLMQVNAGSILGDDGFWIKRFCWKLIQYDMIYLIGSDAHDLKKRPPKMGECAMLLQKKAGAHYAKKILCENPTTILN